VWPENRQLPLQRNARILRRWHLVSSEERKEDAQGRVNSTLRVVARSAVCSNALTIRHDDLEDQLLRRLSESVLRPEAIDYAVDRISQELQQRFESFDSVLERLRQRQTISNSLRGPGGLEAVKPHEDGLCKCTAAYPD
jgi:hypothetical protein